MDNKYYVIEISEGDADIRGKGVYEFAKLNDAVASFHSKLGTAMKSPKYTSETIMVIDSDASTYESKRYVRPVEE